MVLQKRLDYGSSGYQVPAMPHVPRSAKGKRSVRKKAEDNQMCAFDLLATVAGKLLEREETSAAPFSIISTSYPSSAKDSVKQEQLDKEKPHEAESFDHRSYNKIALGSEGVFQRQLSCTSKERSHSPHTASGHSSVIKPDTSDKDAFAWNSTSNCTRCELGHSLGTIPERCSIETRSPDSMESCKYKVEDGIKTPLQTEWRASGNVIDGNAPCMCSLEDPMDLDAKPPTLVSSDSSAEVPLCGSHRACNSSVPKHGDCVELAVDRDDDEKSSGCTHPSTMTSKAFRPQRIGDRRIRKLLASKYWKVAPTMLKDGELSDNEMKPVHRSRKICYTRQRTQRCSFKRRKLFERCTISASDRGMCSEGTSDSPVKGNIKLEASDSPATLHGANGSSSSTGQKSSYESDLHVKFSIKSFKVPELFVEIPETATVGSLKRTVMEAVTAILGGGLRVGVLLQGKKVRDDHKTLLQAGLSLGDEQNNLGFTLEPNPTQAPPSHTSPEDPYCLSPRDATEQLTRIPAMPPTSDQGASNATLPPLTPVVNCPDSDHDSVHSPTDVSSLDKTSANSKALVPVPAMSIEALAVVPLRKSRRSELVQRRIRRPFSVTEVEALVQAVEKLGTGRWRDVKLRAFDNAKHRTYVDLKDKWKTLVHTARISPQQRRGEPVPQELLDRVLVAHAYWAQQQAKLQVKSPSSEAACLLL